MFDPLKLKGRVSASNDADPRDVLALKKALSEIGLLTPDPKDGFDGLVNREQLQAIKTIQRDNGLRVDGVVDPGGPTQDALNFEMRRRGSLGLKPDDTTRRLIEKKRVLDEERRTRRINEGLGDVEDQADGGPEKRASEPSGARNRADLMQKLQEGLQARSEARAKDRPSRAAGNKTPEQQSVLAKLTELGKRRMSKDKNEKSNVPTDQEYDDLAKRARKAFAGESRREQSRVQEFIKEVREGQVMPTNAEHFSTEEIEKRIEDIRDKQNLLFGGALATGQLSEAIAFFGHTGRRGRTYRRRSCRNDRGVDLGGSGKPEGIFGREGKDKKTKKRKCEIDKKHQRPAMINGKT